MTQPDTQPNMPVVMWHYEGYGHNQYREMARTAIKSLINTAAYAADIRITPHGMLHQEFDGNPPKTPDMAWVAYRCHDEPDTDTLIRLSYGVWLNWAGDHGLLRTIRTAMAKELPPAQQPPPEKMHSILGHLVFPDLIGGQLPGTFWLPKPNRLNAAAWPKMPDAVMIKRELTRREFAGED
ncbi:MAG TPA: hypothetical protein VLE73_00305 [Candidatus Saccharimonadales bacterium]|nr:hypothetical protein [Candidatus Saccharimonadales bacterium]